MRISYNKLWKMLIDKNMNKTDLKDAAKISASSVAKLGRCKNVTTDVLTTAKRYITSGKTVTMDDFIELFIQQLTNNANGTGVVEAAAELKKKGVSIRSLAKAVGMPHNTLSYRINKLTKEEGSVNG